ncbi:AbiH family protein [Streptococcus pluranimalium]|uniref:AbiH family protein n=1 Tax=Streptococcus pluranimalium TaxID=82348 RepID=UPI0024151664|nr:AbiH family protein [Streptococcus pluranimalium]WFM79766.1 AbiH family protein [Streptococcus pluranimalium]
MNITYIIGNGLDLQYGVETRYKDFYNYQNSLYKKRQQQGYSNYIYDSLFSDEVNDYENWSDFELSIGLLTKNDRKITITEDNKEKFIDDFADVIDDLRLYLRGVQESLDIEKYTINFQDTLNKIQSNLPSLNQNQITNLINRKPSQHDYVNLLTLNYTDIFDNLYSKSIKVIPNRLRSNPYNFYVNSPIHVHGTLSESTILGVSDDGQISDKFSEEQREIFVKKTNLIGFRENLDIKTTKIIRSSDIVILYGVSLGKTDTYIWKQIAEKSVKDGIPIVIYHYIEQYDAGNPIRVRRLYKNLEDKFIQNCGIDLEYEKDLRQNIITVIGKSIFELKET